MTILSQTENWLKVKDYAKKYKVSAMTVYRMVNEESVTYKRIRGSIRILDTQIQLSEREMQKRRSAV